VWSSLAENTREEENRRARERRNEGKNPNPRLRRKKNRLKKKRKIQVAAESRGEKRIPSRSEEGDVRGQVRGNRATSSVNRSQKRNRAIGL